MLYIFVFLKVRGHAPPLLLELSAADCHRAKPTGSAAGTARRNRLLRPSSNTGDACLRAPKSAHSEHTVREVATMRAQDFKQRLVRLMLETDGSEGCPWRGQIEAMIEAQRWATHHMFAHNPARMMRIALEVRTHKLSCGQHKADPALQRRVLVREHSPCCSPCCIPQ